MSKKVNIFVDGMTCQACSMKVEKGLSKLKIVEDVSVNLMSKTVTVSVEDGAKVEGLIGVIKRLGYKPKRDELKIEKSSIKAEDIEKIISELKEKDTVLVKDEDDILKEIKKLSEKVSSRVQSRNYVGNNISIMVRFSDFKTITRSKKIPEFISSTNDIFSYAWELLLEHYDFSQGVRLLGVSLNDIKKSKELKVQLDIFDKKDYKEEERLRKLSKKLKAEFGDKIITNFENIEKKEKSVITTSFSKDFLD